MTTEVRDIRAIAALLMRLTNRADKLTSAPYTSVCQRLNNADHYLVCYLAYNELSDWEAMQESIEKAREILADYGV